MSITITETTVTHRYLMNKSKDDLVYWLNDGRKRVGQPEIPYAEAKLHTKDWLASAIMSDMRLAANLEGKKPQAYDDFDIPFGHVTTDTEGKRWVFCGWGQTTVSREVFFTRELQPGERISLATPYTYHCTTTETLLKKFPLLTYVRK